MQIIATENYNQYFTRIEKELEKLYAVAKQARIKGLDPNLEPEPRVAKDLAERVEGLVGPKGIAERIRELSGTMSQEMMSFKIAQEIVYGKFGHMDENQAAEQAIRTSLAILTEGITAAPLQGISSVKIKQNPDRTRYLAIYFAGPIRSAGGTEQALILVISDFIRRILGLDRYKPTEHEIKRFIEEIRIYERDVSRFQYHVSDGFLENAIRNLPIEVTGVGTDPVEVMSFRNLPRIETNNVRGGALRVVNDGIVGRSRKVMKIIEELGIEGWDWLRRARELKEEEAAEAAEFMFMEDIVAGRPIFSFPSKSGGFRLRYGRSRNTGLAAIGVHPATMAVLQNFLAIGTQLRIEKPGKAGVVAPVDTIESPIVRLKDGSVVRIESVEEAEKLRDSIDQILFVGDLLVAFGEFLENNKPLAPSGFSEEWWIEDLSAIIEKNYDNSVEKAAAATGIPFARFQSLLENFFTVKPTAEEAVTMTKTLKVSLHPRYTYFWHLISLDDFLKLRKDLLKAEQVTENGVTTNIELSLKQDIKTILDTLRIPHAVKDKKIIITEEAPAVAFSLGLVNPEEKIKTAKTTLEAIKELTGANVVEKAPTFIGARMGRPEKAKKRVMTPPVHVLFPVSLTGGSQRNLLEAVKKCIIEVEIARRKCPNCNEVTYKIKCPRCGADVKLERICPICNRTLKEEACPICKVRTTFFEKKSINIKELLDEACKKLDIAPPELVKGVKGLTSETKTPELIEKGLLRAKNNVLVFKDGTIRFDATNAPLTHFKPAEINVSIQKLHELGYNFDMYGDSLQDPNQICELKIQDIIIPEKCAKYLIDTAHFIDESLQKIYDLPSYYNVTKEEDLLGHLILGLAPHTSAGVIGRVIGFTKASICYAHPLWHAAKRRDCDGDEDAIILVLDALINFSKEYLPSQIGGMMDAPLIITPTINPFEVDDEAHNIDVASTYPIAFYEETLLAGDPKIAAQMIDSIAHRLGTPAQYEGLRYTHASSDINAGNHESVYKKLGAMTAKMEAQLALAEKISAVDVKEVAKRVLTTHFIRDIAGNLKAFAGQKFRCMKCNTKFRRIPMAGKCPRCSGKISLTVHRGGIEKYLEAASNLAKKYGIEEYHIDRISIIEDEIEMLFKSPIEKKKQPSLTEFI